MLMLRLRPRPRPRLRLMLFSLEEVGIMDIQDTMDMVDTLDTTEAKGLLRLSPKQKLCSLEDVTTLLQDTMVDIGIS